MVKEAKRERGSGCLRKPEGSQNWHIYYRVNGRQVRESSHTPIRQKALALLQKRLQEAANGEVPAQEAKRLKYESIRQALLAEYEMLQRHSLQRHKDGTVKLDGLAHLDGFFAGRIVGSITTDSLREFIIKRRKDGAQPSTVNRNLALLRRMMNLARQEGKLRSVPHFPRLKENPARKGFVGHAEFAALYANLPDYLRPLIMFLFWTGCRVGEARQIEWRQVDLAKHEILLEGEQAKTGEARLLPLPDELLAILKRAPKKQGRVFYQGAFRRSWRHACIAAELGRWLTGDDGKVLKDKYGERRYEGLIVHDLRRSAVRNLREAGVSESVVMKISGHKTSAVFRRYSIVSADDLRRAMQQAQAAAKVIVAPARPVTAGKFKQSFDASLMQVSEVK